MHRSVLGQNRKHKRTHHVHGCRPRVHCPAGVDGGFLHGDVIVIEEGMDRVGILCGLNSKFCG